MSIYGTENYVFYAENILGRGSSGIVYFGRHKRRGDACAVKVYTTQSSKHVQVQQNELEYMRTLSHSNIVKCLAIENCTKTNEVALILELCSEKSLQHLLHQPKYLYGLPEEMYISFVGQLASGLTYLRLHGVAHSDIKPGNILCHIEEDGLMLFKLTDFGASRDLLGKGKSTGLFGTEEFLHPVAYKSVFMLRQPIKPEHEPNVELWAIGVTLYQAATGCLPFKVNNGRGDRITMYDVISKKESNVIAGRQQPDGSIKWSKTFSLTSCRLSIGCQRVIIPLLRELMESDIVKQCGFDTYLPMSKLISTHMRQIVVFNANACAFIKCYVSKEQTYEYFERELLSQLNDITGFEQVKPCNIRLYFKFRPLLSYVTRDTKIAAYPLTTEAIPIILIFSEFDNTGIPQFPLTLEVPVCDEPTEPTEPTGEHANYVADMVWVKKSSSYIYAVIYYVTTFIFMQQHLTNYMTLRNAISIKLDIIKVKFDNYKIQISDIKMCGELVQRATEAFLYHLYNVIQKTQPDKQSDKYKHLDNECKKAIKKYNKELNELTIAVNKLEREIQDESIPLLLTTLTLECEKRMCVNKLQEYQDDTIKVYDAFTADKQRDRLTANQEMLHKFEKRELTKRLEHTYDLIKNHCWSETVILRERYLGFYNTVYCVKYNKLIQLTDEIEGLHRISEQILDEIMKVRLLCDANLTALNDTTKITIITTLPSYTTPDKSQILANRVELLTSALNESHQLMKDVVAELK